MEFVRDFPLFTIVFSLFSSVLCMLLNGRQAKRYTVCYECVLLILCAAVLFYTIRTGESFIYVMGEFPAPWGNEIRAGILEALTATAFIFILLCSVLGGWRFLILDVEESKIHLYFTLINLLTAALMSLIWTNDIFTGYVFLEILTLSSCGILIVREIGRTTLAAIRYMIVNLLGSGLFLLGVVLLYSLTGHLLMIPMREAVSEIILSENGGMTITFSLAILTIGLGMKSGLFPFHFWMPDTYGAATPTSASILSALVSKAYIFLLFKIYWRCIGIEIFESLPIRNLLFPLGICGMIFGSVSAIRANHINRMVAFSSAAQIGYIYMGLGMGGLGYIAAMFQIFSHAITKSLLFLTTPRLAAVSGDSLLFNNLQGAGLRARNAGIFFTIGSLSMVGIPIFAGFSSKLLFAVAAAESGDANTIWSTMLALGVSSMLNALYFIRTVVRIYTAGRGGADISAPRMFVMQVASQSQNQDNAAKNLNFNTADMETEPAPESGIFSAYFIAALILTGLNLFLGLFSWVTIDLIQQGLNIFA